MIRELFSLDLSLPHGKVWPYQKAPASTRRRNEEEAVAESIFSRVRRIISGSVEDAVDAMERAGGTSVMREAIREVDRAIDDVRAEHATAAARRLQAMRQQRLFREKLAALD